MLFLGLADVGSAVGDAANEERALICWEFSGWASGIRTFVGGLPESLGQPLLK